MMRQLCISTQTEFLEGKKGHSGTLLSVNDDPQRAQNII
jgi:hypothetical protein